MSLTFQKIHFFSRELTSVKRLYHRAFPQSERMPFYYLLFCSVFRRNHYFCAVKEGQNFVGLAYWLQGEDLNLLVYLAVSETIQSRGLGSKILWALRQKSPQNQWVLNIEIPDEKAENYPQRLKRQDFYLKNGFAQLPFSITLAGEDYWLFATCPNVEKTAVLEMYRKLTPWVIVNGATRTGDN